MSRSARRRRSPAARRCWPARAATASLRVSMLGSEDHNAFTNGGTELFDCAAQGRIDAFFLGGGQIDGQSQHQPGRHRRLPADQGAVSWFVRLGLPLFPGPAGDPVPRGAHAAGAGAKASISSARPAPARPNVHRPGGPYALVTGRCVFSFDKERRRFSLASVHPGHTAEEVVEMTGFDFDRPDAIHRNTAARRRYAWR